MKNGRIKNVCKLFLPVVVAMQLGCTNATAQQSEVIAAQKGADAPSSCVTPARWQIPSKNKALLSAEFLPEIANRSVVLLGEFHDNYAHHQWQLHTLSALYVLQKEMAIGLEMLPRSAQPVLDQWVAGQLSEEAFLQQVHWYEYWKFAADLYMPIYALNVERSLVKRVSQEGWEAIPVADRQGISNPALPSDAYLEILGASYAMHGPGAKSHRHESQVDVAALKKDAKFMRFVQGQQLWDRATAQEIKAIHQRQPKVMVVGIMGSGHIMNRYGVPHQLHDLGIADTAILLPWDGDEECDSLTPDVADAIFGVKEIAKSEKPKVKLGVVIENGEVGGAQVKEVVAASVALAAGVQKGDLITSIAGGKVTTIMDVIDTVQATPAGRWLPLEVRRGKERLELVAKFPLEAASER